MECQQASERNRLREAQRWILHVPFPSATKVHNLTRWELMLHSTADTRCVQQMPLILESTLWHTWSTGSLMRDKKKKKNWLKFPIFLLFSSSSFSADRSTRMRTQSSLGWSIGDAEWKTSDFVVTLIKEQQVPVYLSAQASALQYAPPLHPCTHSRRWR